MCRFCVRQSTAGEFTRRDMLKVAGAGMTASLLAPTFLTAAQTATTPPTADDPLDVRVVYVHQKDRQWLGWPGTFWDPSVFEAKSRTLIEQFAKPLGMKVAFEPAAIHEPAEIEAFINKVKTERPKGVIIFPLNADEFISGTIDKMAQTEIPTVVFCGLGLFHTGFAGAVVPIARRKGVYLPSTSDWELSTVRFGMKMFQAAYRLRRTKVAVLRGAETAEQLMEPLGLTIRYLPRKRFPDTLKTIDETPDVLAMADDYAKGAQKVVEPTRQDMINAAKNYYASLKIMEEEGCQGISMDCLGLVGNREIPTPPCLSWTRLLDNGQSGTCEADVNAVMSQEVCLKLLDKPGFVQDPVPETERGTLIGVHCVCATKLNGWDQPPAPYLLRSHSESNLGVAVQVLWKPGQEATIMQMSGPDKMLLGKGRVVQNFDTPPAGGCRTSVELEIDGPADPCDTKGFHQLFIYGDHVRQFKAYAQMYGITCEHI
ncbi:MAG: hypothetical protein FJ276_11005 [Planctomycetes bacterium]|nr:hypothetical protein [Planctomycetota bacterium]